MRGASPSEVRSSTSVSDESRSATTIVRDSIASSPAGQTFSSTSGWCTSTPTGTCTNVLPADQRASAIGQGSEPKRREASKRAWRSQSGSSRRRLCCSTVLGSSSKGNRVSTGAVLANGALHLQGDQPIHFDGVVHRQRLDDRLDEAVHDHRGAFGLGETAAHEVEELLLADLRD